MNCPVCGSPVQPSDTTCRTCGAPLTTAAEVALPSGTTLAGGQYTISRVLGRGGFGITYDAQDTRLGSRVAIKELFLDGSTRRGKVVVPTGSVTSAEYAETKKRFLDEAKVLASFNDAGIVRVLNYFEENSTAYLVMEFLEGATLGSAIEKRGPVPPDVVLEIARSVTQTLELVHSRGLLHRDIKPDNIFLHKSGRIVLIDFGSVRSFAPGKTVSHTRLVTPGYAPLEQYGHSARFGPYTDIYALGATLFHALTGQMPPPATDLMLGTPLPPLPASTPAPLRSAITKMMALRVEERPQDAHELLALLSGRPATAPPAPVVKQAPAAKPAPAAPKVQPPPPPQPQPKVQPTPSQPAPKPQPQPVPKPQPAPKPQAAPVQPRPAPAPAPQPPVPAAPVRPAPRQTAPADPAQKPAPLARNIFIALGMGLGAVLAVLQVGHYLPAPISTVQYALAGAAGLVVGGLLGWGLWLAMPVVLPLAAAAGAYMYAVGAGLHWPTVASLCVMAAVISIIFLRLIRRVSW
ncbi:serine/threonine-protein kinase PknD [Deinococcus xinjiangensis]|uniref:Serine/threonine-protein kinase PknD n=1 Tax=Deinococcus xinjiangensis TaxID=457454 RepID=A0ABP9V8U6_9DEIO